MAQQALAVAPEMPAALLERLDLQYPALVAVQEVCLVALLEARQKVRRLVILALMVLQMVLAASLANRFSS